MSSLEEYARRSAADAAESVDRLTAPDLQDGPSAAARLALATVAVAALGLVGFAVLRGGDATEPVDAVTQSPEDNSEARAAAAEATVAPTYYAPPIDPDGQVFATDRADRGVPEPSNVPETVFDIYGAGDDLDPLAGGYLVAAVLPNSDRETDVADEFTVRGVPGAQIDGFPDAGSIGIEWQEPDGPLVQLVADVFTIDELVEIADDLDVNADSIGLQNPPPGMRNWVEDGDLQDLAPTTVGWILSAVEPGQTTPRTLQGTPGGEATLLLQRIIFNATEPIDINGRTGYRSPAQASDATAIVWAVDGMILSLVVGDEEDPVEIARSVTPITDDEWAALTERSTDPTMFGEEAESLDENEIEAGSVTLNDGVHEWSLSATDDEICFFVTRPDGSGFGQCTPASVPAGPIVEPMERRPDQLGFVMGVTTSNVRSVMITTQTDELVVPTRELSETTRGYGTALPDQADVWSVTLLDENDVAVLEFGFPDAASYPTTQPTYPAADQSPPSD